MRTSAFSLAAVLLSACAVSAGGIEWIQNDYDKAVAQAKESGKLVLMNWHADWWGYCHKLDEDSFSNAEVQKFMSETFVNLKVDKDKYGQLAAKFKVGGIPDTIFVTGEGRIVKRIVGYMPAEEWLKEIRGVPEAWKKLQDNEAAVAKDEKDAAARVELGRLLIGAGDVDGAEKHLRKATELDADNAKGLALEAWWLMADAQFASDEPNMAKAKEALEKVVALDGRNEKGRRDNADAKLAGILANSDPKGARTAFEKVVVDWPNTDGAFEAMFMIGALMANVDGDLDGAEAQMKKLIEADPSGEWGKRAEFAIKQIAKMRGAKKK